jgi:hypothetical protein
MLPLLIGISAVVSLLLIMPIRKPAPRNAWQAFFLAFLVQGDAKVVNLVAGGKLVPGE